MASALFGVSPISSCASFCKSNNSAAGVPTTICLSKTKIPSWLLPKPSSSSAQSMPSDATPRILAFLISNA